jgi:hypothetical protein
MITLSWFIFFDPVVWERGAEKKNLLGSGRPGNWTAADA